MNLLLGLMSDIEAGLHISDASSVMSSIVTVFELLEQNYAQDKNARNAALDTACALLQKLKS